MSAPEQLDWRWAAATAAAFVLLQNLLDKDSLCCTQLVALFALAVAFPLLILATIEIHTTPDEDKPAEATYVLTVGLFGGFCLLVAISALLWRFHWMAAAVFIVTVLLGHAVSLFRFLRRSSKKGTSPQQHG
jgi:hypothetical protein